MDQYSAKPQSIPVPNVPFEIFKGGNTPERKERSRKAYRSAVTLLTCVLSFSIFAGIARVQISNFAVIQEISSQKTQSSIDTMRDNAVDLQVAYSILSRTSAIESKALSLGMVVPPASDYSVITMEQDVLARTPDGSLSLAGSLERIAAQG